MRVLGVDEIPDVWKSQLNQAGVVRYGLFIDELSNVGFILRESEKSAMGLLRGLPGEDFPYKDIKIGKPIHSNWSKINRPTYMGVLVECKSGVIKLLQGTMNNELVTASLKDRPLPNIMI